MKPAASFAHRQQHTLRAAAHPPPRAGVPAAPVAPVAPVPACSGGPLDATTGGAGAGEATPERSPSTAGEGEGLGPEGVLPAASHSTRVQPFRWMSRLQGGMVDQGWCKRQRHRRVSCSRVCQASGARGGTECTSALGRHIGRPHWPHGGSSTAGRAPVNARELTACCWAPHQPRSASTGPGCRPSRPLQGKETGRAPVKLLLGGVHAMVHGRGSTEGWASWHAVARTRQHQLDLHAC